MDYSVIIEEDFTNNNNLDDPMLSRVFELLQNEPLNIVFSPDSNQNTKDDIPIQNDNFQEIIDNEIQLKNEIQPLQINDTILYYESDQLSNEVEVLLVEAPQLQIEVATLSSEVEIINSEECKENIVNENKIFDRIFELFKEDSIIPINKEGENIVESEDLQSSNKESIKNVIKDENQINNKVLELFKDELINIFPFHNIYTYVLYITEKEKIKFKEHYNKCSYKFNYEFYLGANGYAFKLYFNNFLKKRKEEVKDNPIAIKIKDLIGGKKFYLKNEKQLGHIRSFINIIRNAKKNNYKKICILESDVIFHKNFEFLLKKNYNLIQSSSLLYLGSNDRSISITTNLLPFNPDKSYSKLKKKKPNLSQEELLAEVEKKRVSHHKKRLQFKDIINKNENYFKNEGKYIPVCPYGTFAMIIDESLFDIILEVLDLQIYPTDVLFFYVQSILKDDQWGVLFPNLIICDVSTSSILDDRNQEAFAEGRGWDLNYYNS